MPNLRGKTWTTTTPANVEDAQYWEDHLISDTAAAKAASSVQSVNSITPDQYGNVEIGNAGHTIQDDDGNDMPKQDVLQFVNADVTNDTVNEKTVVDCKGAKGDAATITVGTVTTLPAGSDATVTNSGTSHAAVFNFGIPKGADGTGSVDSVNGYTGTVVLDASDVGALPDSTTIPTKTSELDNDSGFVTSSAIPTSLSELSDDSTHRLVTDAEKTAWNAKVSESLLKDTVGWVGKNVLENKGVTTTYGAGTVTVNADKSVTVNGTFSQNVYFNIYPYAENPVLPQGKWIVKGGVARTSDYSFYLQERNADNTDWGTSYIDNDGNGVVYNRANNYHYGVMLYIKSGAIISNKTFYPVICKEEYKDLPYAPFHPPVEDWYWENNPNAGAKNVFPIEFAKVKALNTSGTWANNIYTIGTSPNELTFTCTVENGYVTGIELNGTPDAQREFVLANPLKTLMNTPLIINGIPSGADTTKYLIQIYDSPYSVTYNAVENEMTIPSLDSNKTWIAKIMVRKNTVCSNVVFSPMLRDARDTDSTYQPYAMTNRELTELAFFIQPFVPSTGDLNNVITTGIYGIYDAPTHSPESANYCTLLVNKVSDNNILQVVFRRNTIYTRAYINGTWYNWFKYAGTELT